MSYEEAERVFYKHHQNLGNAIVIIKAPPVEDKKYSLQEAADRMNISYSQLCHLKDSGILGSYKPKKGRPVIFESHIVKYYQDGHINRTNADFEADAETYTIINER